MVHKKGEYKQNAPVDVLRAAVHPTNTSSFCTHLLYKRLSMPKRCHPRQSLQKVHNFDATNERAIPGGLVGIPVHSGVMLRAEMRIDKANPASLVFSGAGLFVKIGSEAIFPIVPAL